MDKKQLKETNIGGLSGSVIALAAGVVLVFGATAGCAQPDAAAATAGREQNETIGASSLEKRRSANTRYCQDNSEFSGSEKPPWEQQH